MRYTLLFALFVCLATGTRAQQSSPTASDSAAATTSTLTPRQTAEMKADLLMARKDYFEAVRAYSDILKTDQNNAQMLNKMGVAYQQLVDLDHAEHCYKKAMKADKKFASAINNVGTIEYERGNIIQQHGGLGHSAKKHYEKSIEYYQKALELHVDMATIYTNLGYSYMEDRKYPEAMGAFGKALEIDPAVFARKGGNGAIVQQRTTTDPGLFFFFVAKSYALAGDAENAAHYLKLARDDGYKDYVGASKDPAFAKVIKDPRVQEVLTVQPSYAVDGKKPGTN